MSILTFLSQFQLGMSSFQFSMSEFRLLCIIVMICHNFDFSSHECHNFDLCHYDFKKSWFFSPLCSRNRIPYDWNDLVRKSRSKNSGNSCVCFLINTFFVFSGLSSFTMIIPVRCFTCGKIVGNKWEAYLGLLQAEYTEGWVHDISISVRVLRWRWTESHSLLIFTVMLSMLWVWRDTAVAGCFWPTWILSRSCWITHRWRNEELSVQLKMKITLGLSYFQRLDPNERHAGVGFNTNTAVSLDHIWRSLWWRLFICILFICILLNKDWNVSVVQFITFQTEPVFN